MKSWALIPLGVLAVSCTAILGNDFEIVRDGGPTGGSAGDGGQASGGGGGGDCPTGFVDCNGNPGDGCEAELAIDPENCGACEHPCSDANVDARSCAAGVCTPTCTSGFADCATPDPTVDDDGCEIPLGSSANCAACGHDCGAEACTNFLCDPETIYGTAANGSVRNIAVDANNVYWADRTIGYILQATLDGSSSMQLVTNSIQPVSIGVNSTHVYFCEDGGLMSRVLIGGGGQGMIASSVKTVAATEAWIYYDNTAGMRRKPTADPLATPDLAIAVTPTDIAVDGTMVYAATGTSLRSYDETSEGDTLLYSAPTGSFLNISLDADNIYATMADGSTLYQGARNGGGLDPIATGSNILQAAARNGWVYYVDRMADEVRRVPIGGGDSQLIVGGVDQPSAIAANESGIYYGTFITGNIYRVTPPP